MGQEQALPPQDELGEFFRCTPSERAAFEAGIKLGTAFHQFQGTPFRRVTIAALEGAIGASMRSQPYVESASATLIPPAGLDEQTYSYHIIDQHNLRLEVVIDYHGTRVRGRILYRQDRGYPLFVLEGLPPLTSAPP